MADLSRVAHSVSDRQPEVFEKVPPRNRNFTGRDDLLARLRKGMGSVTAVVPQPQAVHGWGGVGKTHLAIEYAHRYRSHYDLIWWIPADQYHLVPSSLASMAPTLGLLPASVTGVEEAAEAVRKALQDGEPFHRWLLIFDNAEEFGHIKPFIPNGPGHVLITSRNPDWEDNFETLTVDVFTREESIDFLRKRLDRPVSREDADRLADKLGDLPLALEQVGALQRRGTMSINDYIEQLDKQASRLLGAVRAPDYPLTMTAAWRVSVAFLEDRLPQAISILRCCAFFGPEPIPNDVFRRGNKANVPRLAEILSDPILLNKTWQELSRFALVRSDTVTRTVQVHRLIQALLRDDLNPSEKTGIRDEVHLLM
ncbi:FxSxx-COOH system tetratricopeptide repeat protein, partial [Acrocarpospora corrugata]